MSHPCMYMYELTASRTISQTRKFNLPERALKFVNLNGGHDCKTTCEIRQTFNSFTIYCQSREEQSDHRLLKT